MEGGEGVHKAENSAFQIRVGHAPFHQLFGPFVQGAEFGCFLMDAFIQRFPNLPRPFVFAACLGGHTFSIAGKGDYGWGGGLIFGSGGEKKGLSPSGVFYQG